MADDNVCFSAKKGEIHAICGENGAGKSTLMKLLFGVEQPNQGRINHQRPGGQAYFADESHRNGNRDGVPALHVSIVPYCS